LAAVKAAIIVACAVAGLVLVGVGAGAYWAVGTAHVNSAVKAVNADIDKMNADGRHLEALAKTGPAFPDLGSAQSADDFIKLAQQFDATAQTYDAQMNEADDTVADGKRLLADAQAHVDSASTDWLTLPHRSALDREKRSLAYESEALDKGQELVNVARKQLQAYRMVVNGMSEYARVSNEIDANDFSAALDDDTTMRTYLTNAGELAQGAHMPSAWQPLLAALGKLGDDTRAALEDLQKGDGSAAQAKANDVVADADALQKLDTSSFDKDPYLDSLEQQIKSLEDKSNALS
jgi:hypothetical protein